MTTTVDREGTAEMEDLKITDSKEVYSVWVNTDLTEGRGHQVPIAVCEIEATAIRLAKGRDVQGTNGNVHKMVAVRINNGPWLAPVQIHAASKEDHVAQQAKNEREAVLAKAKAAGLTDDEIAVLRGKGQR